MIVAFEKLSFSQVTKLFTRYKDYYEAGQVGMGMDESDQFGGSLIDSITSQSGRFRSGLGLGKSFERSHHGDGYVHFFLYFSKSLIEYYHKSS